MSQLFKIALLLGLLTSPVYAATDPAATLAALGDAYYAELVRFEPVGYATMVGDNRFDDQLNIAIDPREHKRHFAALHQLSTNLKQLNRGSLSAKDQLTYDVLADALTAWEEVGAFPDYLLPLSQMDAMPVILANFGTGLAEQPLTTPEQYRAYYKRLSRLPAWIDQAIANMRMGMHQHIVWSRPIVTAMLPQFVGLTKPAESNPFTLPLRQFPPNFSPEDRERLAREFTPMVNSKVIPAATRLAHFIQNEYLPASRKADGWSTFPKGIDWYRAWVRFHTTTSLEPEAIHQLGLKEVERIEGEIKKLAPALGYSGDPRGLLAWVVNNPAFMPFHTSEEILNAYRDINQRVAAQLPRMFGRLPKAALDIREEPPLTRDTASDHYSVPAEDGSRPGVYWAVITDPEHYNRSTLGSLFLHEGQPGHHLQLALQQELGLPTFRKYAVINAYAEGWALYAETLGNEMGLYDDPVLKAGNLRLEMMRAVRLVVDTGIHVKGWTRDQAIQYMADHTGMGTEEVRSQIERYMVWPGQALSYKLGALTIQRLRDRAAQQLGNRFSLPGFHDAVLLQGPLPLSVLEAYINDWITQQRTN